MTAALVSLAKRRAARVVAWRLTDREEQVIDALAIGMGDREAAARLGISPYTVRGHVRIILAKMGARNRAHAVGIWLRPPSNR